MIKFTITHRDKKTKARIGVLQTPHGVINTPSYVIVATKAQVRTLRPRDLKQAKIQVVIANAYHLWDKATKRGKKHMISDGLRKTPLVEALGVTIPTMTDSGGFQVFSYGAAREHGVGKVLQRNRYRKIKNQNDDVKVKIIERGVTIIERERRTLLTPENSMQVQRRLGADIIFAFDECTSPLHDFTHTKKAMERTHRWLNRCIKAHTNTDQILYGIVQGGRFKSLRKQSARYVGMSDVGGVGIGGSFGKDEMIYTLHAVVPYLPDTKPRHLLGIGRIEDIFNAVASGIDTFDCVIPTREARHGRIWSDMAPYDIRKQVYARSTKRLTPRCQCPPCTSGVTQRDLHTLIRAKCPEGARYATLHNVWFFNRLLERIRASIRDGTFSKLRKQFQ